MKKRKTILSVLLAMITALSLCACSVEIGGEETWEYSADNKEDTEQLFNDFFAATFENTNQVVTVKSGSEEISVETIDGTSDYAVYAATQAQVYSFVKDGEYIYAMSSPDAKYYTVSKEYYDYGYFAYRNSLEMIQMLDDASLTYSCEVKGSKKGDESTATLVLEVKNGDVGSIKIEASSKNDLVQTVNVSRTEDGANVSQTYEFAYGAASVTLPDISGWSKEDF